MTAWQEATVPAPALPGFSLQPPRPESELARAGIQGGERLLAMDGSEVHSIWDIQGAFRKHMIGEEVRLLVQRESEAAREVVVRHVSDYPST
jgi:S1-C subfamily serine protease